MTDQEKQFQRRIDEFLGRLIRLGERDPVAFDHVATLLTSLLDRVARGEFTKH